MKLKTLSLATISAIAAMALVGTSSATAEETALCSVNQSPCEEGNVVTSVHMQLSSGTVWKYSGSPSILCLGVLANASVGEPGAPQAINITSLVYTGCGTGSTHNNCTLTSTASEGNPDEATLLETADNLGGLEVTDEGAAIEFECPNVGIKCKYSFGGQYFHVEGATEANHGMLTPEAVSLEKTSGGFFCPETTEVTGGLLEPLEDTYIAHGQGNPGLEITTTGSNPDLFTVDQVKKIIITNSHTETVKVVFEGIGFPFITIGPGCNGEEIEAGKSCSGKRELQCKEPGVGIFGASAKDIKTGVIVKDILSLKCDK